MVSARRGWTPPTLRGYQRNQLRGDVFAGITVAALTLPLGMGLAITAGLGPAVGIQGSIVAMLAFALFSGSRRTMIGPDASVTALVVAAVVPLGATGDHQLDLVATLAVLAGLICLLAAACGAGRIARLLSPATLTGYTAGLAGVVALAQLPRIFGLAPDARLSIMSLHPLLAQIDPLSSAVGVGTCLVALVGARLAPGAPWLLIALCAGSTAVAALDIAASHVARVGSVPTLDAHLHIPQISLAELGTLVPIALAVAVLTFADTVATSSAFAIRHGDSPDTRGDLFGLGAADVLSGCAGALPVSASGARTAAADGAGATSQVTGLVAAAVVAVSWIGAGSLIASLAIPALAGSIVAAVAPMVDTAAFRRMRHEHRIELAAALAVTCTTLAIGVLEGIIAAFGLSLLLRRAPATTSPTPDDGRQLA